ncbi:MAG TPA: nuclear transport factor 2 family protein [Candidatus Saccharimonadales bacterium]|jgi:ketosteroid isomerase-like protein|nr:nuclear transport factor 2 family protein [Candidatus Saccharimonadales bacterium]
MSTAESLQLVKDGYAAFGCGNLPGLLSLQAEDVVWDIPGDGLPMAGSYRGRDGVASFFEKLKQETEILEFQPREFLADGDRVLVVGWERVKIKTTGRIAEADWVMSFTIRDGKIAAFRQYTDTKAFTDAYMSSVAAAGS